MAYVRARTARWIVLVTPRVESGPVGLTLPDRVYEVTVTDSGAFFLVDERQLDGLTLRPSKDAHLGVQDLDVQDLDSDASGTSDPDPPTTPTGNLPPPIIRDNGWWHIPDRPAKPDGGPVGVPTDTSVYPSLGVEADSAGLIPVVVRMENGHAVVGGVSLSAQEFAAYVRDQPQWGFRDLMIFASGAGTRSRVDGVRQESSFARRLRDELGVAVTAPRGDLIHKGGTTWVSAGAVGAGDDLLSRLRQRTRRTGFKHYARVGHRYTWLPSGVDAVIQRLRPFAATSAPRT